MGYPIVFEVGRQILKQQQAIDEDALPWTNLDKFLYLALSVTKVNAQGKINQLIFFR